MTRLTKALFLAAALAGASAASAETVFEAKGPVDDRTPGFRFGNVTFTDPDRTRAKFEAVPMTEGAAGRLTTAKLKLPHKADGAGAYFKFSFDLRYAYSSKKPGAKNVRCNQGVFFYDKRGNVLPDCYDTLYPGDEMRHYERVLYAWDEVDTIEVFFQKPWEMREKDGDSCRLEVANVKVETATWEDAAAYADATYAKLPPLGFRPEGDAMALLPRTREALETGRPWRVVMLGDSIVQDTFNSQFHALVKRAFPKSNVEWILSMRGGTGCWHYVLAENFYRYVADHRPDLLLIGGISNFADVTRKDVGPTGADAMVRVAKVARERLGCEVLLVNDPLSVDLRPCDPDDRATPLPKMTFGPTQYKLMDGMAIGYGQLRHLCRANRMAWWDAFVPCYDWLYGSGIPYQWYSRDAVHSGELGKQIIGRVMLGYFTSGR